MSIYDFNIKTQDGKYIPMSNYKGKVLLIVNTATECEFTPQYNDLQNLYNLHSKDGFEILDFPCNQFDAQAPGTDKEIHNFCISRYKITFPQFSKIDVKGENASPLYKYLTSNSKYDPSKKSFKKTFIKPLSKIFNKNNGQIKWNFTKFIVDREGNIVARFEPEEGMISVAAKVEELLIK